MSNRTLYSCQALILAKPLIFVYSLSHSSSIRFLLFLINCGPIGIRKGLIDIDRDRALRDLDLRGEIVFIDRLLERLRDRLLSESDEPARLRYRLLGGLCVLLFRFSFSAICSYGDRVGESVERLRLRDDDLDRDSRITLSLSSIINVAESMGFILSAGLGTGNGTVLSISSASNLDGLGIGDSDPGEILLYNEDSPLEFCFVCGRTGLGDIHRLFDG